MMAENHETREGASEAPESPDNQNNEREDPPPFFRTWPAMYAFVLGIFVALVILLYLFTKAYE